MFVLLLAPWMKCSRCGFLVEDLFGLEAGFTGVYGTCPAPIDLLELYYCKHLKHMTQSDSHVPLSILELYHVATSIW